MDVTRDPLLLLNAVGCSHEIDPSVPSVGRTGGLESFDSVSDASDSTDIAQSDCSVFDTTTSMPAHPSFKVDLMYVGELGKSGVVSPSSFLTSGPDSKLSHFGRTKRLFRFNFAPRVRGPFEPVEGAA